MRRNLFQHGHGCGLIIDEDPSLAARSNLASQNQRAILRVQTIGFKDLFDRTRRGSLALKHSRDHRPLGARADHLRQRLFPQQQSQRVNQNRLSRPSFPGQKVQTSRELDHDIVDHRVIFKSKFSQHKYARVARTLMSAAFDLDLQAALQFTRSIAQTAPENGAKKASKVNPQNSSLTDAIPSQSEPLR